MPFFLLLLASQLCHAQNGMIEISAGINQCRFGDDSYDSSFKTGIQAGINSYINISEIATLRSGFIVSNQRTEISNSSYSLWYINLPITIQHHSDFPLYTNLGIQVGTILRATTIEDGEENLITNKTNNLNFSILGGLGYSVSETFKIEANYIHSLSNTFEDSFDNISLRNRVIQLSIIHVIHK